MKFININMSQQPDDVTLLARLNQAVIELKGTTKILEKKKILAKYPEIKGILHYVYNSQFVYHVTSKNILKYKKQNDVKDECDYVMKRLLDNLKDNVWSGHVGIRKVLAYIRKYGHEELVFNIIDKDLKIRMGETQINDVFPSLIPTFNVALAETMEKQTKYFEKGGNWFISRKLDGVRCICIIRKNSKDPVSFFSREGKKFTTLGKIEDEIKKNIIPHLKSDIVFDGEICLIENNLESFSEIMKLIKKIDYTIPNPNFIVFDILTLTEFETEISERILSNRLNDNILKTIGKLETIRLLNQFVYTEEKLNEMAKCVAEEGWEGLMLRKDVIYEGKRTKNLLKVKKFHREEYKVIGVEIGKVSNNGGIHSNEMGLKTAKILHKECVVDVGSGFSDEERIYYYKNQNEIIGKVISVQYFEETVTNKKGVNSYSLRFPTFKGIYGESRDF